MSTPILGTFKYLFFNTSMGQRAHVRNLECGIFPSKMRFYNDARSFSDVFDLNSITIPHFKLEYLL